MAIELNQLLERAFFVEDVQNASEAIGRARQRFTAATQRGGISFEIVMPGHVVDAGWLRERLLRPLVYFCESEGTPIPDCPGVFASLFVGARLYGIAAADLLAWAEAELDVSTEELRERYGTQETEEAAPR